LSKTHVTATAVWDGERLRLTDQVVFHAGMRKLKPGDGEAFVVRVEREADAKRYHSLKWLFGYVYKQVSEETGYSVPELDQMMRALHLPADVPTLSLASDEQLRAYILCCEVYAAEVIGITITGPNDARHYRAD